MRNIHKQLQQVWQFQESFKHPQGVSLDMGKQVGRELRYNLQSEELGELFNAFNEQNYVDVLDAIIDGLYICFGTAHYHGFQQFEAFIQHSLAEELDTPEDYPIQLGVLLSSIKNDYKYGTITASNTLSWLVNYSVNLLSLYNFLEDQGVFKANCFEKAFTEVHNSNMSKLDKFGNPIYREDGKVLKGDNYFKPNLQQFINPKYL